MIYQITTEQRQQLERVLFMSGDTNEKADAEQAAMTMLQSLAPVVAQSRFDDPYFGLKMQHIETVIHGSYHPVGQSGVDEDWAYENISKD